MKEQKYKIYFKLRYVMRLILEEHRGTVWLCILLMSLQIGMPYLFIWIPKVMLDGILHKWEISLYLGCILGGYSLFAIGNACKENLEGRLLWKKRLVVNSFLKRLDKKTLHTDYKNLESGMGQQRHQKALQAIYIGAQDVLGMIASFVTNMIGLSLYVITIGGIQPFLTLGILLWIAGEYLLEGRGKACELQKKEETAQVTRKLTYLEAQGASLPAAREIRLYQMSALFDSVYQRCSKQKLKIQKEVSQKSFGFDTGKAILVSMRTFFVYASLCWMVAKGILEVGDFVLYAGVAMGLSGWFAGLLREMSELKKAFQYLDDFFSYLDVKEELLHSSNEATKWRNGAEIVIDNVSFGYEGREETVLKDINLTIRKGEKLAIVGENGSGKTTLIKLLCGLYQPTQGKIWIDGKQSSQLERKSYFAGIAPVFQEMMFLPVRIVENISGRMLEKTDVVRAEASLVKVGLTDKILGLSQGIHSYQLPQIREGAVDFSGGEKQKLWIAKAIYKEGTILLLDEPTAALDPIAESEIYHNYQDLAGKATSLFVSHRLASTSFCDRIVLLEKGRIVEVGTHMELMRKQGIYFHMYSIQSQYYKTKKEGRNGYENMENTL